MLRARCEDFHFKRVLDLVVSPDHVPRLFDEQTVRPSPALRFASRPRSHSDCRRRDAGEHADPMIQQRSTTWTGTPSRGSREPPSAAGRAARHGGSASPGASLLQPRLRPRRRRSPAGGLRRRRPDIAPGIELVGAGTPGRIATACVLSGLTDARLFFALDAGRCQVAPGVDSAHAIPPPPGAARRSAAAGGRSCRWDARGGRRRAGRRRSHRRQPVARDWAPASVPRPPVASMISGERPGEHRPQPASTPCSPWCRTDRASTSSRRSQDVAAGDAHRSHAPRGREHVQLERSPVRGGRSCSACWRTASKYSSTTLAGVSGVAPAAPQASYGGRVLAARKGGAGEPPLIAGFGEAHGRPVPKSCGAAGRAPGR